jgi:hypothetical protein
MFGLLAEEEDFAAMDAVISQVSNAMRSLD